MVDEVLRVGGVLCGKIEIILRGAMRVCVGK